MRDSAFLDSASLVILPPWKWFCFLGFRFFCSAFIIINSAPKENENVCNRGVEAGEFGARKEAKRVHCANHSSDRRLCAVCLTLLPDLDSNSTFWPWDLPYFDLSRTTPWSLNRHWAISTAFFSRWRSFSMVFNRNTHNKMKNTEEWTETFRAEHFLKQIIVSLRAFFFAQQEV